jgi:hypothetical protein
VIIYFRLSCYKYIDRNISCQVLPLRISYAGAEVVAGGCTGYFGTVRSCPSILLLVKSIPFLAISRIAFPMSRVNSTARVNPVGLKVTHLARAGRWKSEERPGTWVTVTRTFRDGSSQQWWALEVITGSYGPEKQERVVIATTDALTLPDLTTFYVVTNLPAPGSERAQDRKLAAASLEEVVRLYGLRVRVEQSYKHVKHAASLVTVPGTKRQGHSTALATGVLRLLVLLLSCQSSHYQHRSRA